MPRMLRSTLVAAVAALVWPWAAPAQIGSEKAIPRHLRDGEDFQIDITALLKHGEALFAAPWSIQEGAGRPQTKGTEFLEGLRILQPETKNLVVDENGRPRPRFKTGEMRDDIAIDGQ